MNVNLTPQLEQLIKEALNKFEFKARQGANKNFDAAYD